MHTSAEALDFAKNARLEDRDCTDNRKRRRCSKTQTISYTSSLFPYQISVSHALDRTPAFYYGENMNFQAPHAATCDIDTALFPRAEHPFLGMEKDENSLPLLPQRSSSASFMSSFERVPGTDKF
jgi:hypothetical protein